MHFPRPIVEACSCGKPAIAHLVSLLENLITHEYDGARVVLGGISGPVTAILQLVDDGPRAMGEDGCEKAAASSCVRRSLAAIVNRCASMVRAS